MSEGKGGREGEIEATDRSRCVFGERKEVLLGVKDARKVSEWVQCICTLSQPKHLLIVDTAYSGVCVCVICVIIVHAEVGSGVTV